METVQIVRCAFMQITAVIYSIFAAATATKLNRPNADAGFVMPDGYYIALFVRDYGFWFLGLVVLWALFASYHTTIYSRLALDEGDITSLGITLAVILAIAGTIISILGAVPPLAIYQSHSSFPP